MYRDRRKRGFVMIMPLIIMSIVISGFMYIFGIHILKRKNILNDIKYELKEKPYEREREYLLSKVYKYVLDNVKDITYENINNILISMKEIKFEKSKIEYDEGREKIILSIDPKGRFLRKEYYKFKIKDKKGSNSNSVKKLEIIKVNPIKTCNKEE